MSTFAITPPRTVAQRSAARVAVRARNAWTKADSSALAGFAAVLSGWLLLIMILVVV